MGAKTGIQWCDSTVNMTTGCDGCELWELLKKGPCYAGNTHEQRLALAMPDLYAPSFTEVRLAPGRMIKAAAWSDLRGTERPDKPWLNGLPRMIFVDDMGDLFSKAVPFEYIKAELIDVATSPKGQRHIWMTLTKQPRRMAMFDTWLRAHGARWPENVWAGTSVTRLVTLKRIDWLRDVGAPVRYVSAEPLLEDLGTLKLDGVSLMIIGGESDQRGHDARPCDLNWIRRILEQCRASEVPALVKQLGSLPLENSVIREGTTALVLRDSHGGDWTEWPDDLRVREMPRLATATV